MSNNGIQVYTRPTDVVQKTFFIAHDIAIFGEGSSLSKQQIFSKVSAKPTQYQSSNADFDNLGITKNVFISAMRVTHNFTFASRASGTGAEVAAETQRYFENFSTIEIWKFDKPEDSIPLSMVLPYDLYNLTTTISVLPRNNPIVRLNEPIEVPAGGGLKVFFNPAQGLNAPATGDTNPQITGNTTVTKGWYVHFTFIGYQLRPAS
jgi:hypothetical protein